MGVNFIWGNFPVSDANEAERFAGVFDLSCEMRLILVLWLTGNS